MILPKVEFKQLDGNSENDLFEAMTKDGSSFGYLVYLRQKYTKNETWEYLVEYCSLGYPVEREIIWDTDWWEGQKFVEYLAIAYLHVPNIENS